MCDWLAIVRLLKRGEDSGEMKVRFGVGQLALLIGMLIMLEDSDLCL